MDEKCPEELLEIGFDRKYVKDIMIYAVWIRKDNKYIDICQIGAPLNTTEETIVEFVKKQIVKCPSLFCLENTSIDEIDINPISFAYIKKGWTDILIIKS